MNKKLTKKITSGIGSLYILISAIILFIPVSSFSQITGPVSTATNNQINPSMATDGAGGTIIAWQDKHNGKYEIYAQRMNALKY